MKCLLFVLLMFLIPGGGGGVIRLSFLGLLGGTKVFSPLVIFVPQESENVWDILCEKACHVGRKQN